ncbi:MAG: transketolase [Actinomycetota bacterium]|nr:transketolase [Actinomycetota bacterium]
MSEIDKLKKISVLLRYYIVNSTTNAGSGHPTSSLSSVELMNVLFFGGFFRYRIDKPDYHNNDRLIFSKGHAAPLLYSLWTVAGAIKEEELMTLRKFMSRLEGHPTHRFPYAEAATGSLGQGLSIGLGMALCAKYIDELPFKTFVLLGDSEMSEGSQWEAIQIACHYKLDNLIGIIDVNGLGQRGQTLFGKNIYEYEKRISSFGWKTILINGHDINEIEKAYKEALMAKEKPVMIIADTVKGKGISIFEGLENWHGKPLSQKEAEKALNELGEIDKKIKVKIALPENIEPADKKITADKIKITDKPVSTRKAYGIGLVNAFLKFPSMVVLDAEVSNSTFSSIFKDNITSRFFEMYITEQNMAGVALGLSLRNKIPFISSFAAFLTRAFDQIRMSRHSDSNIKIAGSHAGTSIGEDGVSQMGLEDIAMFRSIPDCVVLYPSDGISTIKLVEKAANHFGNVYIRTTRMNTPIIYAPSEEFEIGGSKVLKKNHEDAATVITAGITLHEALKAYEELLKEDIYIRIIDLYSIKPIDKKTINEAALETKFIITVEDHYPEGGLGEAVISSLEHPCKFKIIAVKKLPVSGKPSELLEYEEISKDSIVNAVKEIIRTK